MAADEIELGVAVGKAHHVGFLETDVAWCGGARGLEVLGARVDADDLGHAGSDGEGDGAGAAPGVEDGLVPGERAEEPAHALLEIGASLLLQGQAQLDAHVATSALASERASSRASSRVEIVPAARSSSMTPRIRPIAGPGSRPSSSPRTSGAGGSSRRAASTTPTSSCEPTYAERIERPGLGGSAEAMDRARRRILRPARTLERTRIALQLVRDRQARQVLAEDDHEPEVRVVERVEPVVERPPERLERSDVVQPAEAVRRETLELREHALARGLRHERGRRTQQRFGALVHPEAELVLEAHRPQKSQRIVEEGPLGHDTNHTGPEIRRPSCGS